MPARGALLVGLLLASAVSAQTGADAILVRVDSPNRKVRIELVGPRRDGPRGVPRWRAFFHGRPVILDSQLALDLVGGPARDACYIESPEANSREINSKYDVPVGKRRHIIDRCTETVITLHERATGGRTWQVVLRAYDDGVALRYRLPAHEGASSVAIAQERTEFALPKDAECYALPLNSFTTSFEGRYQKKRVADIPRDWLIGLPLLVECPGVGWAGITEANLNDYAGMYLAHEPGEGAILASRLSPLPDDPKLAVRASLPHDSPWRVVLLGESAGSLIESNLIFNLSEPCALSDTSWIHPGKTTFPWWNDYYLEKVPFKPGLNTATMKYYIDFCAEAGIPYHSLDGYQNIGWYGCQIGPHTRADITKAVPEIDLPEVIRYGKSKGVGIRLWLYWEDVKGNIGRAFPLYHSLGVEGVMLDFMNRDDQEMVNFLHEVVVKAAKNHLTVTFHGVFKPTGLERTYPNLLTSEGVLNLEYDKWDPLGCPPEHELTVAFTRMLAGPLDFHQGSLRGVPVEQFKPRYTAPLVMGTPAHMLGSYVVYENHLPMAADYPSAYRGNIGLQILARIPTKWDDMKFLGGSVGEYAIVARRQGNDWYVGAMNARQSRTVNVPLRFLGEGRFRAEICEDPSEPNAKQRLVRKTEQVSSNDSLKIRMESAGGYVAWLTPSHGNAPEK